MKVQGQVNGAMRLPRNDDELCAMFAADNHRHGVVSTSTAGPY
jgi:hypothetical protein